MSGHNLLMSAAPFNYRWTPEDPIFASGSFLESVSDGWGWLGGTDPHGKLRAVLPYTFINKPLVRLVRFRTQTITIDGPLSEEEERDFLQCAMELLREEGADLVIPAATNTLFKTYPACAVAALYGTLQIDLERRRDELWDSMHNKHRNVIRNAEKKGVVIDHGKTHTSAAYELIADTFRRSRMSFMSIRSFTRMLEGLGDYVEIFVARHEGSILGCAVIPYSTFCAYYMYGGSSAAIPVTGAMNLLQWRAITYFQEKGVRKYDFCGVRINPSQGSKQAGLMMFKERFGADLVRGFMWKCYFNPLPSYLYSLAVKLLRGGDIVDQERRRLGAPQ